MWEGYSIAGLATPLGPIFFCGYEQDEQIVAHEMCHIERMEEFGVVSYALRYGVAMDVLRLPEQREKWREWACREERICGYDGPHPVCGE